MAILRNREVQVIRAAIEVDGSTFQVRYPDGETELAKLHELIFTQHEYDTWVKTQLPEVKVLSESDAKERVERTRPELTETDKKRQAEEKKIEEERPEAIKPALKPIQADSPNMGSESKQVAASKATNSSSTAHPATLPNHSKVK